MRILLFFFSLFSLNATEVLWQKEAISLIEENGHCAILINRPLNEMTDREKIAFERTVGKMQNVFQKVFGFGDFTRWMPLNEAKLISYAIPAGAYTNCNEIDYDLKLRVMLFTLKDRQGILRPLTAEEITSIQTAAAEILSSDAPIIPLESANFPSSNILQGLMLAFQELRQPCTLSEDVVCPFYLPCATECKAFCNESILEKQGILQTEENHLIYNYYPYVECHLMVVPKRHISTLSELSDAEILDKFTLFSRVQQVAKRDYPKVSIATRVGWRAGQTQPHLHDHIIGFDSKAEQPWIHNWIHQIFGELPFIDPVNLETIRLIWRECLTQDK